MNRYRGEIKLSLIIYMHRISDNRMSGSVSRNFDLFNRLCGDRAIEHVRLVTSMWDVKADETGADRKESRELELKENFWQPLIDAGARYERFKNTKKSAWDIIRDATAGESEAVLLQEELVDAERRLGETAAGKAIYSQFQKLLLEQKETLKQLADQAKLQQDPKLMKSLEDECRKIEARLEKIRKEMEELKIPFLRRVFLRLFPKKTRSVSVFVLECVVAAHVDSFLKHVIEVNLLEEIRQEVAHPSEINVRRFESSVPVQ